MAFWGLKAALGRASNDLAVNLRTERETRNKAREKRASDRYQSNLRVGEMTLKQQLMESSPEFQKRLGLLGAQTAQAEAGARSNTATAAGREAQNQTYQDLTPEQRQQLAMVDATQASASQKRAETGALQAQTTADAEKRRGKRARGERPEWVVDAEEELDEVIRMGRVAWDWPAVVDKAREMGLTTSNSDAYKDWYNGERKDWVRALKDLRDEGSVEDVIDEVVADPGAPTAIDPLMTPPVGLLDGPGAAEAAVGLDEGAEPVFPPGPAAAIAPPATRQPTPGAGGPVSAPTDRPAPQVGDMDVDPFLVKLAQRWGLDPNDPKQLAEAKRRADAQLAQGR